MVAITSQHVANAAQAICRRSRTTVIFARRSRNASAGPAACALDGPPPAFKDHCQALQDLSVEASAAADSDQAAGNLDEARADDSESRDYPPRPTRGGPLKSRPPFT